MTRDTDADICAQRGWQLLQSGEIAPARREFQQALRIDPASALALQGMAEALGVAGEYAQALSYAERAVAACPESSECYDALGRVLRDLQRHEEAAVAFQRAIRRNPSWSEPYVHLAEVYREQDRPREAEEEFRRAVHADPQNASAWEGLGFYREYAGDFETAKNAYRRSVDVGADWGRPRWLLARLLLFLGRAGEARECLDDPGANPVPDELRAALLAAQGIGDEALFLIDLAEKNGGAEVDPVSLGMAYQSLGQVQAARRYYEAAVEKGERLATDRLRDLPRES